MNSEQIKALDEKYIMHTYKRFDVCFVSGKGAVLQDADGKDYIDFGSGIGTSSLGYGNTDWVEAVCEQAQNLAHCSNLYYSPQMAQAACKICKKTGLARVFFGNSGAEANEGAVKLARKYSFMKYGADAQRNQIITLTNSFHGRTVTTLSATGQDVFHNYFFPFTEGFIYAQPNIESIREVLTDRVCAIMVEPIQGEGGVLPLSPQFIDDLKKLLAEKDILLIADEVQTGCGRTGTFLASQQFNITPDIVTLAKGLAGGLPIGAVVCAEKLQDVFTYSDHGSTFGGNPISCAAANAVLEKVCNDAFLKQVSQKGQYLRNRLQHYLSDFIVEIRGAGLMLGVDLKSPLDAKAVANNALKYGLTVLTAKTSLRFLPPLVITEEEIDEGCRRLTAAVKEFLL